MTSNRVFFIFAVCSCLLGCAVSLKVPGFPTAAGQVFKDITSFPLNTVTLRLYHTDLSYKEFAAASGETMVPFLNTTKKTLIHCHGYLQSTDNPFVYNLIRGYIRGYDYNVIALDYRYITYNFYPSSVMMSNSVSELLLNVIGKLVNNTVAEDDIILSGFSLGAQIVGDVSRAMWFKVKQVIALDPAGPMFNIFEKTITASDAECVKCIHSDMHNFGIAQACGHLDFYISSGNRGQPGCNILSDLSGCSHERATEVTSEAAINQSGFLSIQCDSWDQFKGASCNKSNVIPFGLNAPCSESGKYYIQINKHPPFGRGMAGISYDSAIDTLF